MSSPLLSNETGRKPSSSSLSSLPSRLAQPSALKPPSADVQLDLSSASFDTHTTARTASSSTSVKDLWKSGAAKRAEKAWAVQTERSLYTDPKFKKYLALVERTLVTFDSVSEWADFISFLARLLKTVQAHPNYSVIPRKLIVAKRLAQCLNPALPSGVHQRALEVYHHIFGVIGLEGLRRDLHVWTSGLLPFYQYAATSVKPALLALYESFYLPLQHDLRPLTKALQIALLPGLEDETSESYDRTLLLLDRVSDAVSQPFFLQCLWLTQTTSPAVRLASVQFLTRRMPAIEKADDPTVFVGKDLGLMVRGLSHALEDDNLLVRRGALEVLVTNLPLDQPVCRRFIKLSDRILLVHAALNVVLRKDLSLNRRLYSWLLGPDETPEAQTTYLHRNALNLVRSALKRDFDSDVSQMDRQKPYRVFISLLDKWEIGQSLTRVLILDAFSAIATRVARSQQDDLMTTAKMLFEVVDPFLLFGRFLQAVEVQLSNPIQRVAKEEAAEQQSDIDDHIDNPLALLCFVFKAFHIHDEETKHIHVPLLFSAITQLLQQHLRHLPQSKSIETDTASALDSLELLKLLVTMMPSSVFAHIEVPSASNASDELSERPVASPDDLLDRAHAFYASSETDRQQAARNFYSFQNRDSTTCLIEALAANVLLCGQAGSREVFVRMLDVFADIIRVIDDSQITDGSVQDQRATMHKIRWNAASWATSLMPQLERASSFAEVERIVEVLLSCNICTALAVPVDLNARPVLDCIITQLMRYLEPRMSPYHVRAVELIWATSKVTRKSRIETAISYRLQHPNAFASFGTLWRLSEEVSTDELRGPLLQILDRLRSPEFSERQSAEIWLRANLRSYHKVVDPLLHMLLANQTVQVTTERSDQLPAASKPKSYSSCNYQEVLYALQTLVALSRFGAQAFVRALSGTQLSASLSTQMRLRIKQRSLPGSSTYLDLVLDHCIQCFGLTSPDHEAICSTSAELVYAIVQRGSLSLARLEQLEQHLIASLLTAIHSNALSVQNKMLHTLHTILAVPARRKAPNPPQLLFLLKTGLSSETNHAMLPNWSDFVLMTLPHCRPAILLPLNEVVCDLIHRAVTHLRIAYRPAASRPTFGAELVVHSDDAECTCLESDLTLLIHLSERTLLQAAESRDANGNETNGDATNDSSAGLLAYFSTETPPSEPAPNSISKSSVNLEDHRRALQRTISTLHRVWMTSKMPLSSTDAKSLSLEAMMSKVQMRCRRALERIYRVHSGDTIEFLIYCWSQHRVDSTKEADSSLHSSEAGSHPESSAAFDILAVLAPSAQIVVSFLCDVLSSRGNTTLFDFLDAVLEPLETAEMVQVWPVMLVFAKDALAHKRDVFLTLKIMTTVSEKLGQTAALDDRRLRRDLQDTYVKLFDGLIAGKSADHSTWIRRGEKVIEDAHDADAINRFIAARALPACRKLQLDADRVTALVANIFYYIVAPAVRSRTVHWDHSVLDVLAEVVRTPNTVKTWRSTVAEAFGDGRFFAQSTADAFRWRPIIMSLMLHDRERMPELLTRITASAATANIFANRELEMLSRALNLRRLSYAIFAGEQDMFLPHLPGIQESVVDLLRSHASDVVYAEFYLCMRVLLMRFSARHLSSFWPVLITELLRIHDPTTTDHGAGQQAGRDAVQLVLSTLKLLDLLALLQPDDFQVHEWMFITDTIDAVYPSDDFHSDTMIDHLATSFAKTKSSNSESGGRSSDIREIRLTDDTDQRRLLLGHVKSIGSVQELLPFVQSISQRVFEANYANMPIDYPQIESSLLADMFDSTEENHP